MTDTPVMPPITRRSFITKSTLVVSTLTVGSAWLTACGSSTTAAGPVKIFSLYGPAELPDAGVKDFEKKNPNIKVTNNPYDATKLAAMLAANNAPDVVRIDGAPQLPNYAARGIAADLSAYFQKSTVLKENDLLPINDSYRWDGKTQGKGARYGLVKDWSQDVMIWYNKKIFDQAGLAYPDAMNPMTYDQLLEIGKKLTVVKDGKIQVYGLSPNWAWNTQGHILQLMAQQDNSSFFNSDFTKADFTKPEAKKAFQWYVDWAQAHIGPSPLDPDPAGDLALFLADRLGIVTYGYWFGGYVGTATSGLIDHVAMAPTPVMGPNNISSCVSGTGVFIPEKSKNKDAAWSFVEYFFGGTGAITRAKTGWGTPALKSLLKYMPQTPAYEQVAFNTLNQELPHFKGLHFSPYVNNDGAEDAIDKAILPVMKGQQSLDSALQQLTVTFNGLLQSGKDQVG